MIKQIKVPKEFSRSFLKELLPEHSIIIEAGAHEGKDTLKLSALFPFGTIHAFEPIPAIFNQLQKTVAHTTNVKTYNCALSDYEGSAPFFTTEGIFSTTSSLFEPLTELITKKSTPYHTITVNVTTLDSWARCYAIEQVDFMWLDAQGAELALLQGGITCIKNATALLVEVNEIKRYKNSPLKTAIIDFLAQHNFDILIEHMHHTTWGNVLFYNTQKIMVLGNTMQK